MAQLDRSSATLRISGDDLDPDRVTELLGCTPTKAQRKGDTFTNPTSGYTRTAKVGMWRLEAADRMPEDLDGQIAEILSKLTPALDVWRALSERYELDLFCGFFLDKTNEGLDVSSESLLALGQRGISLGMDIYATI
jgi:hypothetical protein